MKTKKRVRPQKNWPSKPVLRLLSYLLFGVLGLGLISFVSYQLAYSHHLYSGIKIASIDVGEKESLSSLKDSLLFAQDFFLLTPNVASFAQPKTTFAKQNLKANQTQVLPAITKKQTNLDLIGEGQSRFVGSPANRVTNISVASSLVDDTIVPSGGTFSFYETIGGLGPEKGFKEADLIYGGVIQPGLGGGICQVSTTLYRAALNSNLPIVERWPHSLRISYYEQDSPPGLDAAVYFPESDFRFQNNTASDLLIKTAFDPQASSLKIEFYLQPENELLSLSPLSGHQ